MCEGAFRDVALLIEADHADVVNAATHEVDNLARQPCGVALGNMAIPSNGAHHVGFCPGAALPLHTGVVGAALQLGYSIPRSAGHWGMGDQ